MSKFCSLLFQEGRGCDVKSSIQKVYYRAIPQCHVHDSKANINNNLNTPAVLHTAHPSPAKAALVLLLCYPPFWTFCVKKNQMQMYELIGELSLWEASYSCTNLVVTDDNTAVISSSVSIPRDEKTWSSNSDFYPSMQVLLGLPRFTFCLGSQYFVEKW